VPVPLLLIRHGHAGSRKEWERPDDQRPLSPKGRRQAEGLVRLLSPWAVQRILTSPFLRCLETVAPLAAEIGVEVEECPDLAEGNGPAALRLVRALVDDKVAFCTHGDVIPEVLVPLADEDRLDLGPRPRQAKGSTWVLESTAGRFVKATYLPPPQT
jgi:broad specificity phosphatase PhoE